MKRKRLKLCDIIDKLTNDKMVLLAYCEDSNPLSKKVFKVSDVDGYLYLIKWESIRRGTYERMYVSNYYAHHNAKKYCLEELNLVFKSEMFLGGDDSVYSFKCLICDYEFDSTWGSRRNGSACPKCAGHILHDGNRLSVVEPELEKEWHPILNGDLTPYDVFAKGNREVWWICSLNHEWKAKVNNRVSNNTGCPYCYGRFATRENNLEVTNPELIADWDYSKNKKQPSQYKRGSTDYVWWKCKECSNEWNAIIRNRGVSDRGCPYCFKSKGEKRVENYLKSSYIQYETQKEFEGLVGVGGGLLSYDFYLPSLNLLIEYQGEFHDGSGGEYTQKNLQTQQEHDRRKGCFAELHNIKLLEIWYWDFDNIEDILSSYLMPSNRKI